jgi:hypothetical protein
MIQPKMNEIFDNIHFHYANNNFFQSTLTLIIKFSIIILTITTKIIKIISMINNFDIIFQTF